MRKLFGKPFHFGQYLVKDLIKDINRETDPVEKARLQLKLKKFECVENYTFYFLKVRYTSSDHMEDLAAINFLTSTYPKECGVMDGRLYVKDAFYHSLHERLRQHFVRETIEIPSYRFEAGVY